MIQSVRFSWYKMADAQSTKHPPNAKVARFPSTLLIFGFALQKQRQNKFTPFYLCQFLIVSFNITG